MTRLEKCEMLKDRGYQYDPETGKIFGVRGKEITKKNEHGYIIISGPRKMKNSLRGHHFAWYMTYGNVDFWELDHKDVNPSNNRIDNLRISNRSQQNENKKSTKGYYKCSDRNKWASEITSNGQKIRLGRFDTEEEARQAYLQAKEKYHIID